MNGIRRGRNQHWIFRDLESSEAIFGHEFKELKLNAREWWVGLYGVVKKDMMSSSIFVVADPLWKDPEIICLPINPVGSLGLFAPKMKGNLLRDNDGNDHHEL